MLGNSLVVERRAASEGGLSSTESVSWLVNASYLERQTSKLTKGHRTFMIKDNKLSVKMKMLFLFHFQLVTSFFTTYFRVSF
jgi:hypothetical protein